jgi:hypothetical protein
VGGVVIAARCQIGRRCIMAETCVGHEKHMCELMKNKRLSEIKALAKNAQYVCAACGRAAAKAENLCKPEKA